VPASAANARMHSSVILFCPDIALRPETSVAKSQGEDTVAGGFVLNT
jgi:hypothetical protein